MQTAIQTPADRALELRVLHESAAVLHRIAGARADVYLTQEEQDHLDAVNVRIAEIEKQAQYMEPKEP